MADDLAGTVHQVYGGLADPTYLIDAEGRVAYYNMWTFAPNLDQAISALLEQGSVGIVAGRVDHVLHPWPAITDGWKGLSRALPQSYDDLERAAPGSAAAIKLGHALRPLLAPVALRATRPSPTARTLAVAGAFLAGFVLTRRGNR